MRQSPMHPASRPADRLATCVLDKLFRQCKECSARYSQKSCQA